VVMALSFTLLLPAANVVPWAIVSKRMRFDQMAKAQVFGSLIGSATAMSCAWYGLGVWSLVTQPLVGSLMTTVLSFVYCRWRPTYDFSLDAIRTLVAFSANVLGSSVLNYVIRNTDSLLIGKLLGSGPLGYYAMAYQLMLYPLGQVSGVIVRVLFPTLSQLQGDMERFRRAYLKAVSAIALITFPMMTGLYAVSEDFVEVIFGAKWLPMLPVLNILCWVGMIQSIGTTVGTIYLAVARVRLMFLLTLGSMPVFVAAFLAGVKWGIVGVAAAYALVSILFFYVSLAVAFSVCGLAFARFHQAIARVLLSSLIMLTAVLIVRWLAQIAGVPQWERLVISILAGVIAYCGASLAVNRVQIQETYRLVRSAFVNR
jgi:O-antigen/teichoic acid export membrane protein